MVNNRATYQRQLWIPDTPAGKQMVFIPAARADTHLVPAIKEEHKLYFNLCIISFMFMWDPENHATWDVCQSVQPTTCDVDQGVHNTLVVPITVISDANLNHCKAIYIGLEQHSVPHETFRELSEQGKVFNDILQRIILEARFEDATQPKCKIICMWYEGLTKAATYVAFSRHEQPRFKLDCTPIYSGMTVGVCWMSISSGTITAPFLFEQQDE